MASDISLDDAPTGEGLAARNAALGLLAAALQRRAGADEAQNTKMFQGLAPRDRAFARALFLAALRHLGPVDRLLAGKLTREPPEAVRNILRLGATQALFMGAAPHAAVATSVDLAASRRDTRAFRGLVNAVLRGLLRDAPPPPAATDYAPPWLLARWTAAYGAREAEAIAALIPAEPPTDLSPRDPDDIAALAGDLQASILPGGSLRSSLRGDVAGWPGYAEGRWWVQDAAAAIPARLLHVKAGETALDLCAAPGGKALQLAAAGASVVALDRSAARLERLRQNFARMGLSAEVVAADAADWPDDRRFDAVLLDAPCSATGTFRRHPDVLWAARPGDVAALSQVQTRLLDSAARRVRPGGRLVYTVCTLEPEEGEAQVAFFLASHPEMALDPVAIGEGGAPAASVLADGTLRILPHHADGGLDGFFVARFRRAAT
jgi:16S rRNA (cytosine967-C5)-methyltransferase